MATRVAINGFGRIGRLTFRQMMEAPDGLEVVAINDVGSLDNLAYLLRRDTVYPSPAQSIEAGDGKLRWGDREVSYLSVREPKELPWKDMEVDTVIEATGRFTAKEGASRHLDAGAGRVIITAPAKEPDITICMGVNEPDYDPSAHAIISNASCTTNCLAPVARVLVEEFGIEEGFLTTVHALTSSQHIVDGPSKSWRRGRSGAFNIVPASTGATVATAEVLPQLKGRMDGMAMRVPVPSGSVIDFVARTERPVSVESVNEAFRRRSETDEMKGILGISDEQLVSSDIIGSTYSALVDADSTRVLNERSVKVVAWYDNEWGYARRVADLTGYISRQAEARKAA